MLEMVEDIKLRPLYCELNALSCADGGAIFAQGNTSVIAAVHGPVEPKLQNVKIDKAHVECMYQPIAGMPSIKDRLREALIRGTCDSAIISTLHPRTSIIVQVQELDDFGGLDACAINAACLALLIAGIPLKFTFAAVHCIVDKDGELVLDPNQLAGADCQASFTCVFDSLEKNLVTVHTRGRFNMAQLNDAELLSRTASEIVFKFYRQSITDFHNRSLPSREKYDRANVEVKA